MDVPIIKKLDINVVNRIAAGEIIHGPANAVKELIENSIDAKSTSIQITAKSGGLKFLQIQDNGTGIRKEDLAIVCERFTTSKLNKIEDLMNISTYGFRGEALASISHIAHLTMLTKTAESKCAYKASYEDGKLKEAPKACASNQGTVITVEDLFFNLPQRLKTIKSPNEEFQRISDVVGKYAIHNSNIAFVLRKVNENIFRTAPQSTVVENVKIIYGSQISKHLLEVKHHNENLGFKLSGWITDVNYSGRKNTFLFFVNHRLVESSALKANIDEVYRAYLAKGHCPFVYISLELEPSSVDVNIHPTKHEVKFLNEDEIIGSLKQIIEMKLSESQNARMFYKQARSSLCKEKKTKTEKNDNFAAKYPKDNIRTDSKEQKLEKFLLPNTSGYKFLNNSLWTQSTNASCSSSKKTQTTLTSILNMRKRIENACSTQLKGILKEMVFVGVVNKYYSLFQFETELFLCDTIAFSRELFYQILISNFENFEKIAFKIPLKIEDLTMVALQSKESQWKEEDGPKQILAKRVLQILIEKEAIMREYFGIKISKEGELETLPILLKNHKPSMCFLPIYILRLATEVEWDTEDECFETFCRETADYYAKVTEKEGLTKNYKWIVEHVIYPALRNKLLPNTTLKKYLFKLTDLSNLYKVFERC